jgi:hypothetical protein
MSDEAKDLAVAATIGSTSGASASVTYTGISGANDLTVPENLADALSVTDGTNDFVQIVSTAVDLGVEVKQKTTCSKGLVVNTESSSTISDAVTLTAKDSGGSSTCAGTPSTPTRSPFRRRLTA